MLSLAFILCAVVTFLQTDTVAAQNAVTVSMSGFTSGPGGQRTIGPTGSRAGDPIAQVGDFNGDGTHDFVISAPSMTVDSLYRAGLVALFLGHSGNWSEIDLSTVESGPTMMKVYGGVRDWQVGTSVGGAGDVNADGLDDLLISAPYLSNGGLTECGAVFVIFGSPGPYGDVVLSNSFVAGSTGYAIYGPSTRASLGNKATNTIGLLEDINGDGLNDFVVSTISVSYKGRTSAGRVWIIYGSTSTPANIMLNSLQSTAGVMIAGGAAAGNFAGVSIDAVGDFNKDGVVDVLVGAYQYTPVISGTTKTHAGAAYLLFGSSTFTSRDPDLANFVSGPEGVRFLGAVEGDRLGQAVSGAGDVNGDGYADILIGAYTSLPGGKIYVVFGTETPYTSDVDMLAFNGGIAGYTVLGSSTIQQIGYSLSRAGDVNQDGLDDLLCTSYFSGAAAGGQVSILFGSSVSPAANVDFSGPVTAYSFTGTSASRLGSRVAGGFDVNNDGIPDIMLGAPFATVIPAAGGDQRGNAGAVYVVMGPLFLPTDQPTSAPSTQPSSRPSSQPSSQPSVQPSAQPTTSPSSLPTTQPTARPSSGPTSQPSSRPSAQPSAQPTNKPTNQPTTQPTVRPTTQPTRQPSSEPTSQPSSRPSVQPSAQPSSAPTHSAAPTALPTIDPRAGSSPVLSDGGIAGVVVGGVVFLLLLIAAIVLGVKYCCAQGAAAPAPTSEYEMAQVQEA